MKMSTANIVKDILYSNSSNSLIVSSKPLAQGIENEKNALSIFENQTGMIVEMLDSLMGCDLGNICVKVERKPVKNPLMKTENVDYFTCK
jgi:hypothetical protein